MEFKLIQLLPENWLHALGATLFHSLWLGVLLALAGGLVMFGTRKSTSTIRYNLLTGLLVLFVVVISFVFYQELQKITDPLQSSTSQLSSEIKAGLLKVQQEPPVMYNVQHSFYASLDNILNIWNAYANQIVLIWFLVICAKSIQLLVGLNGIYHLRNSQIYPAGKRWDEKMSQLSQKLNISQQVMLMQSGLAKVPMVVGHLKPLILVPLGLLNGLSEVEAEAIISHELAHIQRRDYLINLLQSFIEIIFFFNPAVLWVSQLIKTEREHCCDDLAITCVNDRKNYVKALIFCQEFKQRTPAYAMGITGKNGNLLQRASRMLFNTNSTLNKMEKTILTIALVSTVLFTAAFKNTGNAAATVQKQVFQTNPISRDTSKNIKSADPLVKQMESDIAKKQEIAAKKMMKDNGHRTKANQVWSEEDARQAEADRKQADIDAHIAQIDAKQARIDAKQASIDAEQANVDAKQAAKDTKQAIIDAKQAIIDAKQAIADAKQDDYAVHAAQIPAVPQVPQTVKSSTQRVVTTKTVTDGDGHDYTSEINQELLKDKIISNTNKIAYQLNRNELIVNGVKQPDALHAKYKKKFLKNDKHALQYNYVKEKS